MPLNSIRTGTKLSMSFETRKKSQLYLLCLAATMVSKESFLNTVSTSWSFTVCMTRHTLWKAIADWEKSLWWYCSRLCLFHRLKTSCSPFSSSTLASQRLSSILCCLCPLSSLPCLRIRSQPTNIGVSSQSMCLLPSWQSSLSSFPFSVPRLHLPSPIAMRKLELRYIWWRESISWSA